MEQHGFLANQMALDFHNQGLQNHIINMHHHTHTFSDKISEDEFYKELKDGIKHEKTTLQDRVQGAKMATKAAYQNVKGHLLTPKKYKLKDRVKNISESITSIPEYYKGHILDLKGAQVDKKLLNKYNFKD